MHRYTRKVAAQRKPLAARIKRNKNTEIGSDVQQLRVDWIFLDHIDRLRRKLITEVPPAMAVLRIAPTQRIAKAAIRMRQDVNAGRAAGVFPTGQHQRFHDISASRAT